MAQRTKLSELDPVLVVSMIESYKIVPELNNVLQEKVESRRHQLYVNGSPKMRNNLKFSSYVCDCVTNKQWHSLLDHLASIYCRQDMKLYPYMVAVMLPECILRLLSNFYAVSLLEAEDMMKHKGPGLTCSLERYEEAKPPIVYSKDNILSESSELIGVGTFGKVYKGLCVNGKEIVVKVLHKESLCDLIAAQDRLSLYCHPNLLPLIGYCEKPPSLVFPFMKHFSLFHCLHHKGQNLTWKQRCTILHGTALGLSYCHPFFLHLNLKSQNILLDAEYRAKIADFSVINLLPQKVGSTYFISVGGIHALSSSRGYLPPEYGDGYEGVETDVYSFGILCLETYTGLQTYSETREECKLLDHCTEELKMWSDKQRFKFCADGKPGAPPDAVVETFFNVTQKCTLRQFKKRCNMNEVLEEWSRL